MLLTMAEIEKQMVDVLPEKLRQLQMFQLPLWGQMNAQQMVEHVSMMFLVSTGKINLPLTSYPEKLPALKRILMGERELPRNYKSPVLPEAPLPVATANLAEAIGGLQQCVINFVEHYKQNPAAAALHPMYGMLNFEEWLVMHHKHLKHHLGQFGISY